MLRHSLRWALINHSQGERFYAYRLFYLCFGLWSRDEQERDDEKCYVDARQSLFHSGILTREKPQQITEKT